MQPQPQRKREEPFPDAFGPRPTPVGRTRRLATGLLVAAGSLLLMLEPSLARAQTALPIHVPAAKLSNTLTTYVYTLDLGTLPNRPRLVIDVTPDSSHRNMEIEIEATNFIGMTGCPNACYGPTSVVTSPLAVGSNQLVIDFVQVDPRINAFAGDTVDISVRALSFGGTPAPANVEIQIRGETVVPTATLIATVDSDLSTQTLVVEPFKDTVLYGRNSTHSNGLGNYLWTGMDHWTIGIPPSTFTFRSRLNSLIGFRFVEQIPFNAQVSDADLTLWAAETLNGGGSVSLYRTGRSSTGSSWSEGNANDAGTEFLGTTSSWTAANWNTRQTSTNPWTTPGGDTTGPLLLTKSVTTTGTHVFSSANLSNAVQDMIDEQDDNDGFILFGPYSFKLLGDTAIRFASSNYARPLNRPTLTIEYAPADPFAEGTLQTGVVSFIGEGQDMRWIYDLDDDDILQTDIGGECEIVIDFNQSNYLPYTYAYSGSPSYTGVDCCAWQIDSPQTGTVGTGQALFFHNLDPGVPSNMPPDSDADGILDNCDNCLNVPNGPFLGTCKSATAVGGPCHADGECDAGEVCDQSQSDTDEDFMGDVCDVPEPGLAVGLASGLLMLVGLRRRRA